MVVFFGDKDKKLSTLPYFHHVSSCNFLRKVEDTKKKTQRKVPFPI